MKIKTLAPIISLSTFVTIITLVWSITDKIIYRMIETNIFIGSLFILLTGFGSLGIYVIIGLKLDKCLDILIKREESKK